MPQQVGLTVGQRVRLRTPSLLLDATVMELHVWVDVLNDYYSHPYEEEAEFTSAQLRRNGGRDVGITAKDEQGRLLFVLGTHILWGTVGDRGV